MKRTSLNILAGIVLALTVGLASAGTAAAATNLLGNPGVEQSDSTGKAPASWTYSSWANTPGTITATGTWSTDAHSGTHSAEVNISKYTNPSPGADIGDAKWVPDPVAVTGGAYYSISDWYKSDISSAVDVEYWTASQLDANGQPSGDGTWVSLSEWVASASVWTQYQRGYRMPPGAVYARLAHFIYAKGDLKIDDASITQQPDPPGFSAPMISLTFDDAPIGFYTNAWPIIQNHNFKTTEYVPTGGLGSAGVMTTAEVSTLAKAGQEIGSHSVTHPYMSQLSTNGQNNPLDNELKNSKTTLENISGVGSNNVTDFAYPFGDYSGTVEQHEVSDGYKSGRGVEEGYVGPSDLSAPYDLRVLNVLNTTTVADFESWVDYARAHNYWLIVVFHDVVPDNGTPGDYDTTVGTFSQMLNYLDSTGLLPVTMRDGFQSAIAQINAPQPGSVKISPAGPTTNQTLTATPSGFTDPNNKTFTYSFQWLVNGTPVSGATTSTFNLSQAGHGDHGDKVSVSVTAKNSTGYTSTAVSDSATVANTAPTGGSVAITTANPVAGAAVTASYSGFADADSDTLSYQYSWTVNGQPVAGATGGTLPGSAVVAGTVSVQVTADDGHGGTASASAGPVQVLGYPQAGTVTISPASPTTNQTVSVTTAGFSDPQGDKLTFSYQWLLNGTPIANETGSTLDLSKTGNGDHGDQVQVKVKATDQHNLTSAEISDTITVANTAPSGGSVAITPAGASAGSDLTATPSGFADVDGDQLSFQYSWSEDGQPITGVTGSVLPASKVVAGTVTVQVTAVDGHGGTSSVASGSVTVFGYPQAGSVKLSPAAPTTNDTMKATVAGFTDPQNDQLAYSYQWLVNGTVVSGATSNTLDLSQAGHGDHGDQVQVIVTATNAHGLASTAGDAVTVADTAPSGGSVAITPAGASAGSDLTATPSGFADVDGDALSYQYSWAVNGQPVAGVTGNVLPGSKVVAGTVTVQVTADDGHGGTSPAASGSVQVFGYPQAGSVKLSPAAPTTNQSVKATVAGFTDPQNDQLTYSYQWLVNGTPVAGAASDTLDLSQAGHGDRGDTVQVKVKATNEHGLATTEVNDTVTVANAAPAAGSVAITPSGPSAGSDLTATPIGFADVDGDQLSYSYSWAANGQPVPGVTGNVLPGAKVVAGTVTVQVTAVDGHGGASTAASGLVQVFGYPQAGTVTLSPAAPTTNQTVSATTAGFSDPQGDKLTFSYQWLLNGTPIANETGSTLDLSKTGNGDHGDKVQVKVKATDLHNLTSSEVSDTVTVANTAPTSGTVSITTPTPVAGAAVTASYAGFADADNDTLSYQYSWTVNGQPVAGVTGATLPASAVVAGTASVQVTADDGNHGTASASAGPVQVLGFPQAGTVTLSPVGPTTNQTVSATTAGFSDPQGDKLTFSYQWLLNGTPIAGETGSTLDLSKTGNGDHGDKVQVKVKATDLHNLTSSEVSDTVTVANTAPTSGTVSITTPTPVAGAAVTASYAGFADADNDSLSYQYSWTVNGQPVAGVTGATLPGSAVVAGTVSVQVTADDGNHGTASASAGPVQVLGFPRAGTVTLSPVGPTTNQTVSATTAGFSDPQGDKLTFSYEWLLNGTPIAGETGSTLDLSKVGNGDHGDKVQVKVKATDLHNLTSSEVTDTVTVANTAPGSGSVAIAPTKPYAGDALTATPDFTDADGDTLTYEYSWYQDGQPILAATGATLPGDLVGAGTVKVEVKAVDGQGGTSPVATDSLTVFGGPTSGTVTISPTDPTTNQTLTAAPSGFGDTQGGDLAYHYQWLVNGTLVDGATDATFDLSQPGHGDRGDTVQVKVTATNPHGNATVEVSSSTVTVVNSAPTGGSVAITPSNPKAGADLTATPTGFADADGDQLSYEYTWLENGQQIAVGTGNILPGTWVLAGTVTVQVTAVDGKGDASPVASVSVDVAPATTSGGGGTPAPGTGPGSASTPAAGTGLGSDSTPAAGTGHSAGGAPLGIVVSNPSRPFYRLGQSLVVRYSCSAGSGIASCVATLGLPGAKPVPMTSGKKVQLSKTGRYVLRITATDHKGSTQTTTVYFRVTSDRNAPAIVISSPKGRTYRLGQSLVVRFSCSDGSGVAGCSGTLGRVGGRPSRVSAGSRVPLTTRGRYVLRISARDGVGNADSRTLPFSVK